MPNFLFDGPRDAETTVLLAHGAGAPYDSDWMTKVAGLLAERGFRVARFEFAYMAARRDGQKKPPSKANVLIAEYLAAIDALGAENRLVIGGKSLGGRMASMIAQKQFEAGTVAGLLCLGYPFHPPGSPEKLRTDHLQDLTVPTLICQGERDPFGGRDEVATYPLSAAIELNWAADGDHDLKPRKASGETLDSNLGKAADRIKSWVASLAAD